MEPQIAVVRSSVFIAKDVQFFNDHKGRDTGMLEVQMNLWRALTFALSQASADTSTMQLAG